MFGMHIRLYHNYPYFVLKMSDDIDLVFQGHVTSAIIPCFQLDRGCFKVIIDPDFSPFGSIYLNHMDYL